MIEKRLNGGSRVIFVIATALAVAWEIFAGNPEIIYLNTLVSLLYLAFRLASEKKVWGNFLERLKTFGLFILAGILGICLGAVQFFPFVENLLNSFAYSSRTGGKAIKLEAFKALSILLPNPFGNPIYLFTTDADFAKPNYNEISGGYVGPTVIFLALLALWVARRKPLTWFLAGSSLVFLGVVYGIGPLYEIVTGVTPLSAAYQRLIGYAAVFLITMMVLALHELIVRVNFNEIKAVGLHRFAWAMPLGVGLVFLGLMGLIFWWFSNSGLVPFNRGSVQIFELTEFAFICALFLASLIFLTLALRFSQLHRLFIGLLIVAIFGQLGLFGRVYRAATSADYFFPQTATLTALSENGGRLTVSGADNIMPAEANIWYNIEQVNGYDAQEVRWFEELRRATEERWPAWDNAIPLNLFNIKQLLASSYDPDFQGIDATNTKQLRRDSKQRALNIYLNLNYQAPYRLVYNAIVENEAQLKQDLVAGTINSLDTIGFIQGSAPPVTAPANPALAAPEVKVVSKTSNKAVLKVTNTQAGYLYIDQTYFPGWEAKINGQSAPLYRANYAFTALPVPTGDLTIELEYSPMSFKAGFVISLLAFVGLAVFYGFWKFGRKLRLSRNKLAGKQV